MLFSILFGRLQFFLQVVVKVRSSKKEKREFLPFEEFQKEVKALYPKKGDVKKWYTKERKNHTNWPAAPNRTYKDRGWTSWPELVGKNKE